MRLANFRHVFRYDDRRAVFTGDDYDGNWLRGVDVQRVAGGNGVLIFCCIA